MASELFYQRDVCNVGVDEIVAHSRVAKMTLYKHCPSKDARMLAFQYARRAAAGLLSAH